MKSTKAGKLLKKLKEELVADTSFIPIKPELVKASFEKHLQHLGFDGVAVDSVSVDLDGMISVLFVDFEETELEVMFGVDEDGDPFAIPLGDDGEDDGENESIVIIDLSPLDPPQEQTPYGVYLRLTDLSWMNKSTVYTILASGDVELLPQGTPVLPNKTDAKGNRSLISAPGAVKEYGEALEDNEEEITEAGTKIVVRGGKRVRLPLVKKRRRVRLSAAQRAGIRRGAKKRKARSSQIQRKRSKSLKVRKRSGLKAGPSRKGYKVQGS